MTSARRSAIPAPRQTVHRPRRRRVAVRQKDLVGVGFDQVERIPIGELDLAAPDLRRHTAPRQDGSGLLYSDSHP